MVESEYFLDDTGHQIPVEFSRQGFLTRIMETAKGVIYS
jgi:hypothetical protein